MAGTAAEGSDLERIEEGPVLTSQSKAGARNQDAVEGDGSLVKTRPSRDLWAQAWNSPKLSKKEKGQLANLYKALESRGRPSNAPKDNGHIRRQKRSKENGRKVLDSMDKESVQRLIFATTRALDKHYGRYGTQDDTGILVRVLELFLTFKALGDGLAKFDPSGYGTAAWAVVSFGLAVGLDLFAHSGYLFTPKRDFL